MRDTVPATLCWLLLAPAAVSAQQTCGSLENAYGPFDYSNPQHHAEKLPIVERAHFDENVRNLEGAEYRNKRDERVPGDIEYTLRAFPNHHVALDAMSRYYALHRHESPMVGRYTPECWFDRAIRFKPDDGVVRMVYGIHLYRLGKLEEALVEYKEALRLMPSSAEVHYNLGLLYVELGQLDLAVSHAAQAYEFGFPLPGLRNKLASAGRRLELSGSLQTP